MVFSVAGTSDRCPALVGVSLKKLVNVSCLDLLWCVLHHTKQERCTNVWIWNVVGNDHRSLPTALEEIGFRGPLGVEVLGIVVNAERRKRTFGS